MDKQAEKQREELMQSAQRKLLETGERERWGPGQFGLVFEVVGSHLLFFPPPPSSPLGSLQAQGTLSSETGGIWLAG